MKTNLWKIYYRIISLLMGAAALSWFWIFHNEDFTPHRFAIPLFSAILVTYGISRIIQRAIQNQVDGGAVDKVMIVASTLMVLGFGINNIVKVPYPWVLFFILVSCNLCLEATVHKKSVEEPDCKDFDNHFRPWGI